MKACYQLFEAKDLCKNWSFKNKLMLSLKMTVQSIHYRKKMKQKFKIELKLLIKKVNLNLINLI